MWMEGCEKPQLYYVDSYYNKHTADAAKRAAQGGIASVDKVMSREWKHALGIVRPPGHHSGEKTRINGFCVFNTVAIAAKYAQKKYGVKKICILDWDVHHGDGTQHIFYEDDSVLFISLHRYDNAKFYPHTSNGHPQNTGKDKGKGYNINIAWNLG